MKLRTVFWNAGAPTAMFLASLAVTAPSSAQTVTIVGTQHLRGLDTPPTPEQYEHTLNTLSVFAPTQVCIERMSGERLQVMAADPMRNAMALSPQTHSRPLGTMIIPQGVRMQARIGVLPADAREQADELAAQWDSLSDEDRLRLIALQVAGYEFHSAVLNWSYLDDAARQAASESFLEPVIEDLNALMSLDDEAYALAVPLARRAGLHQLCTADDLAYEAAGMTAALDRGGQALLEQPEVAGILESYQAHMESFWRPDAGPEALTQMLAYMNSDAFARFDREIQWETLRTYDNDQGAFQRRLMYWHARTAQISSELYRALAQGEEERVLLIIGAAHRPFNEAEMRTQPWLSVEPASSLVGEYEE